MLLARRLIACSLLAACAGLAGCTTSDRIVDLGGGVKGYHIVCSGVPISGPGDCDDRANDLCPNGYSVLNSDDPAYQHAERLWSLSTHDLTVSCNPPTPPPPPDDK